MKPMAEPCFLKTSTDPRFGVLITIEHDQGQKNFDCWPTDAEGRTRNDLAGDYQKAYAVIYQYIRDWLLYRPYIPSHIYDFGRDLHEQLQQRYPSLYNGFCRINEQSYYRGGAHLTVTALYSSVPLTEIRRFERPDD
jgi:hypothetical protein